jgi:hypothetical protein
MKPTKPIPQLILVAILSATAAGRLNAQAIGASGDLKWLVVNSLHAYFSEQGSESETGGTERRNVTVSWPGQYGIVQSTMRAKGMWLGSRDYDHPLAGRVFPYYITNVGLKPNEYPNRPVYDAHEFMLIAKEDHPLVVVDGVISSNNTLYDTWDDIDEELPADRMIVVTNHTSIGVTVTKKVLAFTQQYHDNYFIYDYVIRNTGFFHPDSAARPQRLKDFWFLLLYRYALSGESVWDNESGVRQGWGTDNSSWGQNVVNDVIGTDAVNPETDIRANLAWYGPHSDRPLEVEDDWGCPNQLEDGLMAAAKFAGHITLHADMAPDNPADDPKQPRTTHHIETDCNEAQRAASVYDEPLMEKRYALMSKGHAAQTHAQEVELSGLPANEFNTYGGSTSISGYGPYTLEPGDSIHIVVAGAVAGLSREKNREVGAKWLEHYKGTGTPELVMPDGSAAADHTTFKKAWVLTCRDSLMQTFRRALRNFKSGYAIPRPPPPPKTFEVASGGDRITLTWSNEAEGDPNFDGYVIYRSEGNVLVPKTVYREIFRCGKADAVNTYNDTTAVRNFDYYYTIQSKDNGSTNDIEPGKPLKSNMFWTLTTRPARLLRKAGTSLDQVRVVPNPYDIRARIWQFGKDYHYDRIAFNGLPPVCKIRVFTERGDLIWDTDHTNGSGDELWDSMTQSRQIIVSGIYILHVEVTEDRPGFKKGDSVVRKFVVIR